MSTIQSRLALVKQRILEAETHYGRTTGAVTLLAVSKSQTVENIQLASKAGQRDFGENYIQEALQKINALQNQSLYWHFIGQIQSNKTRDIAASFDWVHSVDKVQTAKRLSQQRPKTLPPLNICLQVNVDQENTKAGFPVETLKSAAQEIISLPNLKLRGLMAIPEARDQLEKQRQPFHRLKQMLVSLNQTLHLNLDTLSMGMSNDLEAAIAEGATLVRIGTAIFGPRQQK